MVNWAEIMEGLEESEKFTTVKPEEVKALLQNAIATRGKLFVWTSGQKYRLHTRIVHCFESGSFMYFAVNYDPDEAAFEKSLKSDDIQECLFNLTLPTDIVFFKGEIKKSDRGFLNFKVSLPVYKVQRRRNLRMPVTKMNLSVTLKVPESTAACRGKTLDLSEGGMAFALEDESQAALFEPGSVVTEVLFALGTRTFRCEGEIRYRKEIASSKVKKIFKFGLQFKGLTKDEREIINGWVLEECSGFFGRL